MNTSNGVLDLEDEGEEMRKLVALFGILLVIVAITGVGQTIKPNPVTPDSADPFAALWAAIQDLQNQIRSIPAGQACWDLDLTNHYSAKVILRRQF